MEKMIKHFIVVVSCLMFFVSCESDSPTPDVQIKLVSIEKDGEDFMTYAYDNDGTLASYKVFNETGHYNFVYYYNANGRIDSVQKMLNSVTLNASIVYYYVNDAKIQKLEYYDGDYNLYNTATYTYTDNLLTKIDNSDKAVQGNYYKDFEYSTEDNVSMMSTDFGNDYYYTYFTDKPIETPLSFDISDPMNINKNLVSELSYVPYTSYTITYEFDENGLVTTETRNYPERPENDPSFPQVEVYTYTYETL